MEADDDLGLLAITISDSEGEAPPDSKDKKASLRDGLAEEDFQQLKAGYRPKIENGEVSEAFLVFVIRAGLGHFTRYLRASPAGGSQHMQGPGFPY
jgi:hypothetical protein